jgi:hypothetical protein
MEGWSGGLPQDWIVLELDPHPGKVTCGRAGELLAWYSLRSVDLGRVVSPGTVVF